MIKSRKITIGYKVLDVDCNSCYSRKVFNYKKHKRTYHRFGDGPLAMFDTLKHAEEFVNSRPKTFRIYQVKYRPSKKSGMWYLHKGCICHDPKFFKSNFLGIIPCGTRFATWVKLGKYCGIYAPGIR